MKLNFIGQSQLQILKMYNTKTLFFLDFFFNFLFRKKTEKHPNKKKKLRMQYMNVMQVQILKKNNFGHRRLKESTQGP